MSERSTESGQPSEPSSPRIRRALLSVSDKAGIGDLARMPAAMGVEIVSTGGTAQAIRKAGVAVRDVADLTGFPEMMDGRVKTLHPKVHGGLLAVRGRPDHDEAREAHGIEAIDLVAIDLYPFEAVVAGGAGLDDCIENIDIGGPAMIRSAAKNHASVTVIVDPADYDAVIAEMRAGSGATSLALRRRLAAKAYARTAAYDAAISGWFAEQTGDATPAYRILAVRLKEALRYGENPHQSAAFYTTFEARPGVATATQVQGKQLSYNNINDTDAAFELAAEFDAREAAAVAIIKHANPCGVAVAATLEEAYRKALICDPVSAFGGVIAVNRPLDGAAARAMTEIFTEVIMAPDADDEARAIIAQKKNLRLLLAGAMPDARASGLAFKSVAGGMLAQSRDNGAVEPGDLKVVTRRQPGAQELADLLFAFKVAKHVKSNAIVYARGGATVGIGAGQMSRVDSARIAARKSADAAQAAGLAEALTRGSVAASDAFFPFADGLQAVVEAGATAVIQPGGSVRDEEVIAAADEAGIAMVFTGMRHFRH